MTSIKIQFRSLTAYELHKRLINDYVLNKPGATIFLKRNKSNDKTDIDIIRENHRFLWDDRTVETWEEQLAKKYYDKLFKEYCISDLSHYKENMIAMRWRTEQEVVVGKGQFICGNKKCDIKDDLRTWEVNFAYTEQGTKKNALVKLRLCPECSIKLNYHSKKREIKRLKGDKRKGSYSDNEKKKKKRRHSSEKEFEKEDEETKKMEEIPASTASVDVDEDIWGKPRDEELEKSREEEFEEFFQELFL